MGISHFLLLPSPNPLTERSEMYLFDLHAKLRLLNDQLFIDVNHRTSVRESDAFVTGLWLNKGKTGERVSGLEQLNDEARAFMEDDASGAKAEFMCGIPSGWIPEYDEYDGDSGRVIARGWRSLLVLLTKKQVINIDRARRLFSSPSLGLDDYDRLGYEGKLTWARGNRFPHRKTRLT